MPNLLEKTPQLVPVLERKVNRKPRGVAAAWPSSPLGKCTASLNTVGNVTSIERRPSASARGWLTADAAEGQESPHELTTASSVHVSCRDDSAWFHPTCGEEKEEEEEEGGKGEEDE